MSHTKQVTGTMDVTTITGKTSSSTPASAIATRGVRAWGAFANERDQERYYLKSIAVKVVEVLVSGASSTKDDGHDGSKATKSSSAPASPGFKPQSKPQSQSQTKVTQGQAQAKKAPALVASTTPTLTSPASAYEPRAAPSKAESQVIQEKWRQGMEAQALASTPAARTPPSGSSKSQGRATQRQTRGLKPHSPAPAARPATRAPSYKPQQTRTTQGGWNQGRGRVRGRQSSQEPVSTPTTARPKPAATYKPRAQATQGQTQGSKTTSAPTPATTARATQPPYKPRAPQVTQGSRSRQGKQQQSSTPTPTTVRSSPATPPAPKKTLASTPRVVEKFDKACLPVDKAEFEADSKRMGLRVGLHLSRWAC